MNCSPTFKYLIPLVLAASLFAGCASTQAEPTATITSLPSTPTATVCTPSESYSPEQATLVPPVLVEIDPDEASPGEEVKVLGSGGYTLWHNGCVEGINESSRDFELYFDEELAGSINCMLNHCEVDFTIPLEALPGNHTISIVGSSLDFLVSGD